MKAGVRPDVAGGATRKERDAAAISASSLPPLQPAESTDTNLKKGNYMTTIQELKAEFGSSVAGVLNRYHEHLNKITAQREPGDGVYLDRLTDEQRMDLLREQKMERASEITEQAREDYRARVEAYHTALAKRTDELKSLLFEVQDAGALSRAALATDTELGTLLELASTAGNKELGKAAFVASEQRGLGNLLISAEIPKH